MPAKTLMIQGTASHVGKSVLTAAFCRLFTRQGLRVAPFKAQNMSNNSYVTPEGHEIGRAQAVQAAACHIAPHVDFNPVLIKPASDGSAQLIVGGQVAGDLSASDFGTVRREHGKTVFAAFDRLAAQFELIILEGAGSPAEINLRDSDIVNMAMARHATAPVLLVGDIDRGGVFASLIGTLSLLEPEERQLVRGFIINKFRGNAQLLTPGLRTLTERTGVECVGVVPHWSGLEIPQEDSVGWDSSFNSARDPTFVPREDTPETVLRIGVVDLPYLSNFTDLDSLSREPDVRLIRLAKPIDCSLDALILPGTKNTAQALRFVKERGLDAVVQRVPQQGGMVVGLCGGYQIIGRQLLDPFGVESSTRALEGLGMLNATTTFAPEKVTVQVSGRHRASGCQVEGYEVHMGRTVVGNAEPLLDVHSSSDHSTRPEGAVRHDGLVLGTYVHGLFDAPPFRRWFLNRLRARNGWSAIASGACSSLNRDLDQLADFVEAHVDMDRITKLVNDGA